MTLSRRSTDPDPVRAAACDLMVHLLELREAPAGEGADSAAWARHERAHAALGLVLEWMMDPRMVAWCPEIRDLELFKPLLELHQALQDQSDGLQPSLLSVKRKGPERRPSTNEAVYKARCLVLMEAIQLADGCGPEEAATHAENALARLRAKKPIGGYKDRITATTLKEWRKELSRAKAGEHKKRKDGSRLRPNAELAHAYDRALLAVTSRATSRAQLRQLAEALIDQPPP